MANMVLACFFAGRGIYHFIDNNDMLIDNRLQQWSKICR